MDVRKVNITLTIIILCIFVFLLQGIFPGFTGYFILSRSQLTTRPWTILTSVFLHETPIHLIFNMLALFMFGLMVEGKTGRMFFLALFVICGLIGSIGFLAFVNWGDESALGASGAIYGLIGALLVLEPRIVVLFEGIPMPMYVAGPVYAIIELVQFHAADDIAHTAHIFGFAGGMLMALGWKHGLMRGLEARSYIFAMIMAILLALLLAIQLH